jgi:hypothetical protein
MHIVNPVIYEFRNLITDEIYIGATEIPDRRKEQYLKLVKSCLSKEVIESVENYGIENHQWQVLMEFKKSISRRQLRVFELNYIKLLFASGKKMMNVEGCVVREFKKRNKKSPHIKLTTQEKKKDGYDARKCPVRITQRLTGKVIGDFTSMKDAADYLGIAVLKLYSSMHRKKPTYTVTYLDESKRKHYVVKENRLRKVVQQIDKQTGEVIHEFSSLSAAYRETGVSNFNISAVCHGKLLTAGGFKWRFKPNDNV